MNGDVLIVRNRYLLIHQTFNLGSACQQRTYPTTTD
uniref:Uncharacterized protein n=1 Tax=Setaria italica TaxID=4555 RepID=K4ANT1_SETIT